MEKTLTDLKEAHARYVKLLKEEIEKERNEKLDWKNKYMRVREGARALSQHAAIITHLEQHIEEQNAIITKYQKRFDPVEFIVDTHIEKHD